MSEISFDSEEEQAREHYNRRVQTTGIIGWLLKKGVVKTKQQANLVLGLVIVIGISYIILNLIHQASLSSPRTDTLPGDTKSTSE